MRTCLRIVSRSHFEKQSFIRCWGFEREKKWGSSSPTHQKIQLKGFQHISMIEFQPQQYQNISRCLNFFSSFKSLFAWAWYEGSRRESPGFTGGWASLIPETTSSCPPKPRCDPQGFELEIAPEHYWIWLNSQNIKHINLSVDKLYIQQ